MDRNALPHNPDQILLLLTLPSGKVCRITASRESTAAELIAALQERNYVAEGTYGFMREDGLFIMADMPLSRLYAPGAHQATAVLTPPPQYPEDDDETWTPFGAEELYGCPTAVTAQADLLTDCTVTRTDL